MQVHGLLEHNRCGRARGSRFWLATSGYAVCHAALSALLILGGGLLSAGQATGESEPYESPRPGTISHANKQRLTPLIDRIAKAHRVDPALVHAVISAESGYDPKAVSPAGAIGLMQLMPATAEAYDVAAAEELFDPRVNVTAGTRHLSLLLKKYRNISHALKAYNAGEGVVDRNRRAVSYLETRKYVVRVIKYYWAYKGRRPGR